MSDKIWQKKIHVQSSMNKKGEQYSAFIGRWQPLHDGHKSLFQQVLDEGGKVLIMIRDIAPDEKNPFTAEQVKNDIASFYEDLIKEGKVSVVVIPDIEGVHFGRGVGYDIVEWIPPAEIGNISATEIRKSLVVKSSADWLKESDYEILDADGWDRNNFGYSFYIEKITKEEFEKRIAKSTIKKK